MLFLIVEVGVIFSIERIRGRNSESCYYGGGGGGGGVIWLEL